MITKLNNSKQKAYQIIRINGKDYTVEKNISYYSANMADKEIRDGHIKYCGQFYKIVR